MGDAEAILRPAETINLKHLVRAFTLRSSEGWRPGLELNQDKERCTAPASTPFRHRAEAIIAYRAGAGHALYQLTLTAFTYANVGRATNVIRQGLWPIFCGARTAE